MKKANPIGVLIPNNAGLVTTTAANDLVHTTGAGRKAMLRKIMWSNRTGFDATLIFGTLDAAAVPNFVPFLPTITALTGFDGELTDDEIPDVIWQLVRVVTGAALTTGRTGNVIVLASVAGVLVRCTVEER